MICLLLNLGSWNCPVQANSCFYRRSRSELQWLLAVLLKLSRALAGETELVHTKGRDGSLVPNTLLSSRRENQTSLLFKDMGCSQLRVVPKAFPACPCAGGRVRGGFGETQISWGRSQPSLGLCWCLKGSWTPGLWLQQCQGCLGSSLSPLPRELGWRGSKPALRCCWWPRSCPGSL